MQLKSIFTDDEAVSPVIGVILMVAITVILAAVIGAFVLGIGGSQEQVPSASWEMSTKADQGSGTVSGFEDGSGPGLEQKDQYVVQHKGGESIDWDRLTFQVSSTDSSGTTYSATVDPKNTDHAGTWFVQTSPKSGKISAGNSITLKEGTVTSTSTDLYLIDGGTISIVWDSSSSEDTQVLTTHEI